MRSRHEIRRSGLVLALLAGCATTPDLSRLDLDSWLELRARDFAIVADIADADLRRYAEDLAILVAVAGRLTNVSPAISQVPVRVVLAPPDVYGALVREPRIPGIATTRLEGHWLLVRLDETASFTQETLLHEYTHFLEHKNRRVSYPLWYGEGFAELLSTVHRRDDLVSAGAAPWDRLYALRRTPKLDLEPIFAQRRDNVVRDVDLFYALSWATVHYLSEAPERRVQLQRFLALRRDDVPWRDAVTRAFDASVEQLSERVDAHVRAILRGVPSEIAAYQASELALDRDWQVGQVSAAEVAAELGDIALPLTSLAARAEPVACDFFAHAVEEDPRHARARAASALCDARAGDFEAADVQISDALRAAPDDSRVAVRAGQIEVLRARADSPGADDARRTAREAFVRATALAPADPVAWAELGASYAEDDRDPQPGIDALERAQTLGAWDADVNLDLGRLLLRAGRRDAARERFAEVARIADGDPAREAERLLAELAPGAEAP